MPRVTCPNLVGFHLVSKNTQITSTNHFGPPQIISYFTRKLGPKPKIPTLTLTSYTNRTTTIDTSFGSLEKLVFSSTFCYFA